MYKVLLVEDNDTNRDMLTRRLERRAYSVTAACDGAEGIRLAESILPDIILMDISLPEIDGHEATRHLKKQTKTRSIPVIALTAHAMPEDRRKAMDAGCDEFETKPVDLSRLVAKMDGLLARCVADGHESHRLNGIRSGTCPSQEAM